MDTTTKAVVIKSRGFKFQTILDGQVLLEGSENEAKLTALSVNNPQLYSIVSDLLIRVSNSNLSEMETQANIDRIVRAIGLIETVELFETSALVKGNAEENYTVQSFHHGLFCPCKDFEFRAVKSPTGFTVCKHIYAVLIKLELLGLL